MVMTAVRFQSGTQSTTHAHYQLSFRFYCISHLQSILQCFSLCNRLMLDLFLLSGLTRPHLSLLTSRQHSAGKIIHSSHHVDHMTSILKSLYCADFLPISRSRTSSLTLPSKLSFLASFRSLLIKFNRTYSVVRVFRTILHLHRKIW